MFLLPDAGEVCERLCVGFKVWCSGRGLWLYTSTEALLGIFGRQVWRETIQVCVLQTAGNLAFS